MVYNFTAYADIGVEVKKGKQMKSRRVLYQPEDQKICKELLTTTRWHKGGKISINDLLIQVGKYFTGRPYVANALEIEGEEVLVVNLRQFDCFTFLENVIALARLIEAGKNAFSDYTSQLEKIRYREGRLKGYASRLHYFSDWLFDNREKGIVRDITAEIGGKPYTKDICFMTRHTGEYPALKDDAIFRDIFAAEQRISGQTGYLIPKAEFEKAEPEIESGNLIGIATKIEGLDFTHVGFAVWVEKHIHLLHASREEQTVVVSNKTLGDYLDGQESISGVVVAQVRSIV